MGDAPEKIWAEYGTGNWITSREEPRGDGQKASYIREDVALAMVAAGVLSAANALRTAPKTGAASSEYYGGISDACNMLPSLTPDDAKAALDRLIAEAVERGFWIGRKTGGSKAEIDAALEKIRRGDDG